MALVALTRSDAVSILGRANDTGRSLRGAMRRSRHMRIAVGSPPIAISMAF